MPMKRRCPVEDETGEKREEKDPRILTGGPKGELELPPIGEGGQGGEEQGGERGEGNLRDERPPNR